MSSLDRERLDSYRRKVEGSAEDAVLDDYLSGALDRRAFLRRASVVGVSAPAIGAALRVLGDAQPAFASAHAAAKQGGRIRVAIIPPPTGTLEPHTLVDVGGLEACGITGEFLTRANSTLGLSPELAVSWKADKSATVWTFKLRPNVHFQSGQVMSADDVVTTYNRLVDPNSGSQALSAFKGVLSPGGITKVDDLTVQFKLDAPNAHFPYLTSSTTYQAIILPASYQLGTFTSKPQTTGGFQIKSYTPGVGISYDRFPGWWGGTTPLDGVDATFYTADAAVVSAMLAGTIDLIGEVTLASARPLLNSSTVKLEKARGATHRQICIRTDLPNGFRDPRVRQALALTLDRPNIIKTLWLGLADLGNDSPFAPVFPSTSKTVPQRHKDLAKAKQLMAAAGKSKGFAVTLTTEQVGEIPLLAQTLKASARLIGIDLSLSIGTATQYFAGTQTGPPKGWGSTPWLNTPINITDWSHRAVPNVYLTSAYVTKGVWNASHYSNPKLDALIKSYIAAISVKDQRNIEAQMQRILLHDTPTIIPYFQFFLQATSTRVAGFVGDASGHIYLSKTSLA